MTLSNLTLIDWIHIMLFAILLLLLGIGSLIGISLEKKGFNNGVCPQCNIALRHFDTDSHGGRLYTCDKCRYFCSVSWNIDKNYKGDRLK